MSGTQRLCIGMPVYNAERYLAKALDSLLAQTFNEFTLIVVDNASTDRTASIVDAYRARDPRVQYWRNASNIGAAGNWYRALDFCNAEYFKWAADDDLYEPTFLERCVAVLDDQPAVALAYTRARVIDADDVVVTLLEPPCDTMSPRASDRFQNSIALDCLCIQLYGVVRTSVMRQLRRYRGYVGEDRNLLAELCLRAPLYEIGEPLFLHRLYEGARGAVATSANARLDELLAYDPSIAWGADRSTLKRFVNYATAVGRVPLPAFERARCWQFLVHMAARRAVGRLRQARPRHA